MYIIRKKFKFEMAHQLLTSYTKQCQTIHGHSYILELFFASSVLDENGMVVDFGEIKDILGDYINTWDHALVLHGGEIAGILIDDLERHHFKIIGTHYNPTAENMACDIYWSIAKLLQPIIEKTNRKFQLWKVILHETDTGYAEYQPMQFEEKQWKEALLDSSILKMRENIGKKACTCDSGDGCDECQDLSNSTDSIPSCKSNESNKEKLAFASFMQTLGADTINEPFGDLLKKEISKLKKENEHKLSCCRPNGIPIVDLDN